MDWNDLKIALMIARTGSLTRAASLLGVNQSTVGRRLTALEADLDTTLFRRSKQGLALTEAGELLVAKAAEIESRAERIPESVASASANPVGVVRLLGIHWIIDRLVGGGLKDLLERHPGLSLRITTSRPKTSLWRGEPGLGLWFEQQAAEGAFAIQLGLVPYAVYRARDSISPQWVAFHDEDRADPQLALHLEKLRRPGETLRLTAVDAGTLRTAIASGMGQGLLPVCIGDADTRLIRARPDVPDLERRLYLHTHPDSMGTTRVQVLMTWLRDNFPRLLAPSDRPEEKTLD